MRIKKMVLLLSMLVLVFSMTACSDGQEKVDFNYTDIEILNSSIAYSYQMDGIDEASKIVINNTEGQEVLQNAITNFETAREECGELQGFRTKDGKVVSFETLLGAQSDTEYQQYLMLIACDITEEGANVEAVMTAVYEDRDAEVSFVYEAAPRQAQRDETTQQLVIPFQLSELTVAPVYTFGEQMGKAAMNTLMGMGTVFVILIFIALIIGQFEKLSNAIMAVSDKIANFISSVKAKRAAKKEAKETASDEKTDNGLQKEAEVKAPAAASENLIQDTQLVAVITAAIMAAQGMQASAGSDGLIVRSIKKAKR